MSVTTDPPGKKGCRHCLVESDPSAGAGFVFTTEGGGWQHRASYTEEQLKTAAPCHDDSHPAGCRVVQTEAHEVVGPCPECNPDYVHPDRRAAVKARQAIEEREAKAALKANQEHAKKSEREAVLGPKGPDARPVNPSESRIEQGRLD